MQRRRDLLKGATGAVAGFALMRLGPRLAAADPALAADRLSANLLRVTGAGCNVVVLTAPERLALVDSGAPEHADALVGFVHDRFEGAPVEALFNTHWHLSHTGGNDRLAQRGARIFAHENTRLWMSTEYFVKWENRTYSPRAEAALPTETFYASDPQPIAYELAGHAIEYGHLPEAHTDGDIYVRFPDENVIAAGDAVGADSYPVPDFSTGGWIGGLQHATRLLIELSDSDTRIVPGSGPVQTRADLEAQLEMLTVVRDRVNDLMTQGKSAEEMLDEGVTREFDERWGDPRLFVSTVYNGMWWGGRVRGPI